MPFHRSDFYLVSVILNRQLTRHWLRLSTKQSVEAFHGPFPLPVKTKKKANLRKKCSFSRSARARIIPFHRNGYDPIGHRSDVNRMPIGFRLSVDRIPIGCRSDSDRIPIGFLFSFYTSKQTTYPPLAEITNEQSVATFHVPHPSLAKTKTNLQRNACFPEEQDGIIPFHRNS